MKTSYQLAAFEPSTPRPSTLTLAERIAREVEAHHTPILVPLYSEDIPIYRIVRTPRT